MRFRRFLVIILLLLIQFPNWLIKTTGKQRWIFFRKYLKYGENAFTVSWPGKNNYLLPAINLLPRVIEHIKRNSCKGVLVLPYWLSAAYWPLTATSKTNFLRSVTDYKIFDNPSQCFPLGNNKKSLIGLSNFNGPVLALQFSS